MDVLRPQTNDSRQDRATRQRPSITRTGGVLLVIGAISVGTTGCASRSFSMASMNPFKKKTADNFDSSPPSNAIVSSVAGVGTATKNAMTKTTETVGGWFGGGKKDEPIDSTDPLALQNMPEKVGPDVYVANGQLWESTGNLTKAMESYTKALQSEPNHGAALTSIARLHFREGNHPKAAEFFQKAIAQTPNDAALYNDLGLTLSKLNQHDLAAQTLARALQLAPGTSRYANNLASVQFEAGKTTEAFQVLSANNQPAVAHFNMAYLHYKKGQASLAQGHLQQALQYQSDPTADPATKRAVERSREMLAQLTPGGTLPTQNIASTPSNAATAPSAVIAANPAHKTIGQPQVVGGNAPAAPTYTFGGGPAAPPISPASTAAANSPTGVAKMSTSGTPTTTTPAAGAPTFGTATSPVSYQDPRSYMSPTMPSGAPTAPPAPAMMTPKTSTPAASTPSPTWTPTPPSTAPAKASSTSGFQLPTGFGG